MNFIIIKRGTLKLEVDRSEFLGADQTPDGVLFSFKYGLTLYVNDSNMPISTKDMIKQAGDAYQKGNLTFDLGNYAQPTSVDIP